MWVLGADDQLINLAEAACIEAGIEPNYEEHLKQNWNWCVYAVMHGRNIAIRRYDPLDGESEEKAKKLVRDFASAIMMAGGAGFDRWVEALEVCGITETKGA